MSKPNKNQSVIIATINRIKCMCGLGICPTCNYSWTGRHPDPQLCPKCGSPTQNSLNNQKENKI